MLSRRSSSHLSMRFLREKGSGRPGCRFSRPPLPLGTALTLPPLTLSRGPDAVGRRSAPAFGLDLGIVFGIGLELTLRPAAAVPAAAAAGVRGCEAMDGRIPDDSFAFEADDEAFDAVRGRDEDVVADNDGRNDEDTDVREAELSVRRTGAWLDEETDAAGGRGVPGTGVLVGRATVRGSYPRVAETAAASLLDGG